MATTEAEQRLFVALWPPDATSLAIHDLGQHLRAESSRPIRQTNLHITLAFVGRVAVATHHCLCAALNGLQAKPFDLTLDRMGVWPQPRILWLAPAAPPPPLIALALQVQQAIIPCGYEPDTRPYQPHVTLARKLARVDTERPVETVPGIHWPVRDLVLARSISAAGGPRYEVLRRWTLG